MAQFPGSKVLNLDKIDPRDLGFNPPLFDPENVAEVLAQEYGIEGELSALVGERDQNFRLDAADGRKFVVKIAGPDENPDVIDFQLQALLYLKKNAPQVPAPRIFRGKTDRCIHHIIDDKGVKHAVRVLTYLDGIPYGEGIFPGAKTLQEIGAFQGSVVNALSGFDHKASKFFMPWNLSNGIAVSKSLWALTTDEVRNLGEPLIGRLRHEVLPKLNSGPSQIIHNDAHSYNLLRPNASSWEIVGLIDFGDMVYAPVINDLAVMATSFHRLDREDLDTVENLLIGFHRVHPLLRSQVSLLWDAITLRTLIMILLSEAKLNMSSDHDPDIIEERMHGIEKLQIIRSLDHTKVVNRLCAACEF